MRVFDVLTPEGEAIPLVSGTLFYAYLVHPHAEEKRDELMNVMVLRYVLDIHRDAEESGKDVEPFDLAPEILEGVIRARPFDVVIEEANRSYNDGWVAGAIALLSLQVSENTELQPTRDAIIEAMAEHITEFPDLWGDAPPVSASTLWNRWNSKSSVSHVHALIQLFEISDIPDAKAVFPIDFSDDPTRIMRLSDEVRKRMERYRITKSGDLYTLPADFGECPELGKFPPPEDSFLKILKRIVPPRP